MWTVLDYIIVIVFKVGINIITSISLSNYNYADVAVQRCDAELYLNWKGQNPFFNTHRKDGFVLSYYNMKK